MDQVDHATVVVREALAQNVIGAYLYGSAVFGGLHPLSDVDVLAVTQRPATPDERRALIARLLRISGRGDPTGRSRSVELTIVVQRDVRPWRYPPRLDLQYGEWWRREFEGGNLEPWESPNPDVALLLEMVLQANHPLFGPPPAELLDPVPSGDLRRAMLDGIPGLLADLDGDEANVVLTLARIWTTLETGMIWPKDAAADWVLSRLSRQHQAVLAHARAIYLGDAKKEWTDLLPGVRPHVNHVLGEIQRVASTKTTGGQRGTGRL